MIPTYNCAGYLRETLASVLAQDPGPEQMQIEVVDDYSTADDPEAVVREVGMGRVSFYRQPQNVGHVRNFETCLLRSRGRLVHLLHGDDRVREGFYRTMQQPFEAQPEIGAAFCRHLYIDENGHWVWISRLEEPKAGVLPDWLTRIGSRQRVQTPSIVVRREVYERLGGFDRRIQFVGEDWEMWVRIAAHYPVWYEPTPLAEYRKHRVSLTARSLRSGQNIRDLRCAVELSRSYLPPERAAVVVNEALEWWAVTATRIAGELVAADDWRTALVQMREAIRCSRSPRVLKGVAGVLVRLARRGAKRTKLVGAKPLSYRADDRASH